MLAPESRGHVAMLAFSALIAGSFSLGRMSVPYIEPAALNIARFALSVVVATSVALALGRLPRRSFQAPWRYAILGGLFAIYFVTMFEALKTVTPVSTAAVFTLTPMLTAILGRVFLRQPFGPRVALALAAGGIGAIWMIFRGDLAALRALEVGRGEMIFAVGCLAHGVYPLATRALTRGEPALAVNVGMLAAGLVLLIAYGWSDFLATPWGSLPPIVWITIVYTSVGSGVMTFTLLQYASMLLPGGKVMAYTYLVPAWVVVWEMALGRSGLPWIMLPGLLMTAAALFVLMRDR
jgi:drug/metabolite transporter (DMT)-like permease